ncbi:MAG: NAD(P)H-hydrate dehydratase [Gracilibacteraceae bacterium]|jgi:NAD(P)H-hydrate epimerase|nr:NAD(P)H-hydrate dehydratase [Gracilibacteraceae bacterium]
MDKAEARLVTAEQMRRIDARAINDFGLPGLVLMENAALALTAAAERMAADKGGAIVVLAGRGNNGGDGFAVARQLAVRGRRTTVFFLAREEEAGGDAALNLRLYRSMGGRIVFRDEEGAFALWRRALRHAALVVDALYGTGFRGRLPAPARPWLQALSDCPVPVLAVDLPSGLNADTGEAVEPAVRATCTVTLGLPKIGLFTGQGPLLAGETVLSRISIPETVLAAETYDTFLLTPDYIRSLLPRRHPLGHKGTHGRGVLIAGSRSMSGAAVLAGQAALRSGIGLLQVVTAAGAEEAVKAGLTEATVWAAAGDTLTGAAEPVIAERLAGARAWACGPGLGREKSFLPALERLLHANDLPAVLDADALNLLAGAWEIWPPERANLVLTPHPGEMARLCGCRTEEIQAARLETARRAARQWGAVVVLKGAGTIVAAPDGRAFINPSGNAGLGTGGTGDVLTGAILAYLAQGLPALAAACAAVYLHGAAGDHLRRLAGGDGYTALEVAAALLAARRELGRDRYCSHPAP